MKLLALKEIKDILPYLYPMLMLDRAVIESDNKVYALKNITFNEIHFHGHFPNHPIMPGVLQVESMVQTAQLLAQQLLDPDKSSDLFLKRLDKVKFRKPNNPGDRMRIDAELISCENGDAVFKCSTTNNSGVCCQAGITLSTRPKTGPQAFPELFNEFDKSENIYMDVNEIIKYVPHRYPFLLIDNVISASEDGHIVAVKNLSANEELFQGYTPDYPVLPGSIQAEIFAQAGCAHVLSQEQHKGKLAYFMGIDSAEYLHPVFPGDQLICDVQLPPFNSRFGKGVGVLKVDSRIVAQATVTFAVIDPQQ